jgi:hypothetical protein
VAQPLAWASNLANHLRVVLGETKDSSELISQTSPRERQTAQELFYDRYEDLVDVIVAAAQFITAR